jgi:hypothetical protein
MFRNLCHCGLGYKNFFKLSYTALELLETIVYIKTFQWGNIIRYSGLGIYIQLYFISKYYSLLRYPPSPIITFTELLFVSYYALDIT